MARWTRPTVLFGLLVVLTLLGAVHPAAAEVPPLLSAPVLGEAPVWVALEHAVDEGRLAHHHFPPDQALRLTARLERLAESSSDADSGADPAACNLLEVTEAEYFQLEPTPDQLLRQSTVRLRGRVTDRRIGFFRGAPATLLELLVEQTLVWPDDEPRPETIFVVYGDTRLEIEGRSWCHTLAGSGPPPPVGARIEVGTSHRLGTPGAPAVEGTWMISPMPQEVVRLDGRTRSASDSR